MSFNIGNNIKNLRIENNMTEFDLSTILSCSVDLIRSWESGDDIPDINYLPKLASAFNVTVEYLTTGKTIPIANFDELLEKVTVNDDINKLADNLIKGIDKENRPLMYYVIKNESINIFNYLIRTNKFKYALNNMDVKNFEEDLIYLAIISNNIDNLSRLSIDDISINKNISDKAYIALVSDNRVTDDVINTFLSIHKTDINKGDYLYMPSDERHVKGLWQIIYPKLLDFAIEYKNIKLMHKIYSACYDANTYAIKVIKENKIDYKLSSTPLSKYDAQRKTNIPIVTISMDILNKLLLNKYFTILKSFNSLNKAIKAEYIDFKEIEYIELKQDKNSTDLDLLKVKFVKYELLNVKELLKYYTNPTDYEKHLILTMLKIYPISYLELVNNLIIEKNYKKLFEFSIDYELDNLSNLIMKKKYNDIMPYTISLFGYIDVLHDGHIKVLKENIKALNKDIKGYAENNNNHMVNRCYEKIAKLINDEKDNWFNNMIKVNQNLNQDIYYEMLDEELNTISFSVLMTLNENNIKQSSDNYKIKLYNEYLKKVGASNE